MGDPMTEHDPESGAAAPATAPQGPESRGLESQGLESQGLESQPREIGFLLIPGFAMMAFFAAIEPLRIANRCSGRTLYRWSIWSEHGEPVAASNGMTLLTDGAIGEGVTAPTVFVCSSFDHDAHATAAVLQWPGPTGIHRPTARPVTIPGRCSPAARRSITTPP